MLISIGMTAFNARETLPRALRSALDQDWPDTEILVVDDGSTDGTWTLLEEFALRNPGRIRPLRTPENLGVAGCRNLLIREAAGEVLAFFDDDDVSEPARLSRQVRRLVAYERDFARGAPVVCHAARLQTYPDGLARVEGTMGCAQNTLAPHGPDVAAHILFNRALPDDDRGSMATCSQMARKAVYESVGGFDPAFRRSEDTELNVRLARAGAHFVGLSDPLVHQTMTRGEDKRLRDERRYAEMLYDKHADFLKACGRGRFDKSWLDLKYDYLEGAMGRFALRLAAIFLRHPVFCAQRALRAWPRLGYNRLFRNFHSPRPRP